MAIYILVGGSQGGAGAGATALLAVSALSLSPIALSGTGQTVSGHVVTAGDRIFAVAQTPYTDDGIYVAAAGAWSRAVDAPLGSDIGSRTFIVEKGTYAEQLWVVTNDIDNGLLGTHDIAVTAAGGGGGSSGTTVHHQGICAGLVNNSNTIFTIPLTPDTDSLVIYRNGVKQQEADDYTRIALNITFATAPSIGDTITYEFETTTP